MTVKSLLECERNNLEKFEKFQLPSKYKKIGFIVAITSLFILLLNVLLPYINEFKELFKFSLLIGLLIVSISKDKNEDELIIKLRMISYRFAFIIGIIEILLIPIAAYLIILFTDINKSALGHTGKYDTLFVLLFVQVFIFEYLKKLYK